MRGASPSTCLTSPIVAQNSAWSACLLHLLFQTPTLLSKPKTARSFPAANRHVIYHDRQSRTFSTTTQRHARAATALRSDPIAFVDSNGYGGSDAPSHTEPRPQKGGKLLSLQKNKQQNQFVRPSTVTVAEQTVFDRLIKQVSGPTTPEEDGEDILDQEELISGYDPDINLDGIFEEAIKRLRLAKEQAAESAARNLSNPVWRQRAIDIDVSNERQALFWRYVKRPLGTPTGAPLGNQVITGYEREKLEKACDGHRTMVLSQLDLANSDEKIWQILQDHVFSLVVHLKDHIKSIELANENYVKKTEPANETGAKKNRKGRKARKATTKEKRAPAAGKDIADVRAEQREPQEEENPSANLSTTKAIPENELLLILHRNYAEYCLHALRLFRRQHPTSLYAMQVLATIKDLGPISYVLGVSTDVYNESIFLQWTQYSDLHGMADTMAEMLNQGIEGNDVTVALIKGIAMQKRRAKGSFAGPVMKEWWHMRGNVEGWKRVQDGYQKMIEKLEERAAALTEEVASEDEALERDGE